MRLLTITHTLLTIYHGIDSEYRSQSACRICDRTLVHLYFIYTWKQGNFQGRQFVFLKYLVNGNLTFVFCRLPY